MCKPAVCPVGKAGCRWSRFRTGRNGSNGPIIIDSIETLKELVDDAVRAKRSFTVSVYDGPEDGGRFHVYHAIRSMTQAEIEAQQQRDDEEGEDFYHD